MERLSYPLLALLAHWFTPMYNARLQFLEAQIHMLRLRIDTNRIVPSAEEKDELLRLGSQLDHNVGDLMHVVRPKTYRKWLNRPRGLRRVRRAGRPRMPMPLRRLIERIGEGNPNWGYRRAVGELKKLGLGSVPRPCVLFSATRASIQGPRPIPIKLRYPGARLSMRISIQLSPAISSQRRSTRSMEL